MMMIPEDNFDKDTQELFVELDVELEATLETALQELKERPGDIELVDHIFRSVDKLKAGR